MKFTRRSAAPSWLLSNTLAQSYAECYDALLVKVRELCPDAAKPKHQYGLRLAEQYLRTGVCIDCYTMERKHRLIKSKIALQPGKLDKSGPVLLSVCLAQKSVMISSGYGSRPSTSGRSCRVREMDVGVGDVLWIQEEKLAGPILGLQGALGLASFRAGQDERSPSLRFQLIAAIAGWTWASRSL